MNDKRYKWILYTIVTVIVVTIGIQVFWNYKNYQSNKQQLINDVQVSLDKAVDDYYTALAERTTIGIFFEGDQQESPLKEGGHFQKILQQIDEDSFGFKSLDSIDANSIEGITVMRGFSADSMSDVFDRKLKPIEFKELNLKIDSLKKVKGTNQAFQFKSKFDSIKNPKTLTDAYQIEMLTSKIVVSINNDSLDLVELDSLVGIELLRKKLYLDYDLHFNSKKNKDTLPSFKNKLHTSSKSTFLPKGSSLNMSFSNETATVLKRSFGGILISTLLIAAVISSLFYLLKIIKHQKQLAEVKNDLISNITHEFKTPIATIGVALESINNFNAIEDKEKTKNYINMSSQQLEKLNLMVEKLLETATLDSNNLELNKESIDVVTLLNDLSRRYKIQYPEKEFNTSLKVEHLEIKVDSFHFENALNNILDNAVKYGGDIISIDLIPKQKNFQILISDNGNKLSKANKERIFEKFYRVPKGNTHDVKGFGIGLYYTKSIIEKHGGTIDVSLAKDLTTFKITLPNG
ncbi:MAG: two-component sensor histidine kinase [Flavobacteriaceae bacterium]|nr:two-component sensor histidine kinase [Flavobacteriaceae bacterium]MBD09689.1 two-component sensor histidine kinase [Flavobacteriaceae bacterium]|tara:strand:+ start:669 stop:2225 length:1557 start_codon:yes stop_codon:yes gene_type:complete